MPTAVVGATIIARESLVLCGEEWVNEVFRQVDENVIIDWYIGDGSRQKPTTSFANSLGRHAPC